MQSANASATSLLQKLPDDLKAIIFEYVPLVDLPNLSLVCQDFNSFLRKNPDLWAHHLFRGFLDIIPTENPFKDTEENFFEHALMLSQDKIMFSDMTDAPRLLGRHHNVLKQWKAFFSSFLSTEDCGSLLSDVFGALDIPNYPPPYMKKDIHYFPTNTLFQNFLTEVYFDVNVKPFIQERRQTLVEKASKQIKEHLFDRKVDKDDLLALRWYQFEHEKKDNKSLCANLKASLLSNKSKIIKKRVVTKRQDALPRRGEKKTFKKAQDSKSAQQNEKAIQKYERLSLMNNKNDDASVEDFYWMLQNLMENYCQMIFSYLRAIHDPYLLVAEYTRLWNKYTLLILDFSQTFNPLAQLFNTLYEDVCKNLPAFPKFSTWRLMVKVWISQVYSNLSYFLGEAFRSILMKVRSQKKASCTQHLESCPSCRTTQRVHDGSNAPYDHFLYKIERNEKEREDIPIEELTKILKGFYYSVDDISFNEFSIFYWDCNPSDKRTPKGILDSLVLQDTKRFYEYFKECFWQGSSHYKAFLTKDNEFMENIFGKQFGSEMRLLQSSSIKGYLANILNHAVQETESLAKAKVKDSLILRRKYSLNSTVNLKEMFRCLSVDDNVQKKILETQKKQDLMAATLGKDGRVLNSYIFYLEKEQEEIASQITEFEDMRSHRALRGFTLADQKYQKFFELGQNPSLSEVEKVGLEGKDLKEEVEQAEESLVFL